MRIAIGRLRKAALRQGCFPFLERQRRHERWFKESIVLTTCLVIALILRVFPWTRYLSAEIPSSARQALRQMVGLRKSRPEIDESWRRYRQKGIEDTRPRVSRFYGEVDPAYQRLLRYAGMGPEHVLIRWGNYDWTFILSSVVFEPDDLRSYRFRPRTHSIWLKGLPHEDGGPLFFLVPDGPGLADAIRGTPAKPVESSRQTTNSWGLRGQEPDLEAPLRGIVLGDSYMQGMFIGDDETPPVCLQRYLQDHLKTRVSLLNTGVMGYSPEQYYYSLVAFVDRFRPQFVVVSVFLNDFGNIGEVGGRGVGDWEEGKYWLEKILSTCQARKCPCLVVPAPFGLDMLERRHSGFYPGKLSNILDVDSMKYIYPIEDFVNAHLESRVQCRREGRIPSGCVLFNGAIGDDHFSPVGSRVWANAVGHRLVLLLEDEGVIGKDP